MRNDEIRRVIAALYDPAHPAHPRERQLFDAAPSSHLRRILSVEGLSWTEEQIHVAAVALLHPASAMTIDLAEAVTKAEDSIDDFVRTTRPGHRLTLAILNAVFYLGVAV